jgi:hypothetical protein
MPKFLPGVNERNNFKILLLALVFFMFGDAIAEQFQLYFTQRVVNLVLMATLVINVWAVDNPRTDVISWKWGATMVISLTMITDSLIESNVLAEFQVLMAFTFLSLTTWQAWNQVMFTGRVDSNKIIGSICIYLLMGMCWAFAYLMVEAFAPGSMHGLTGELWQEKIHDLIYYSMVTLTTLGYGDITPALPITRFLAYMEAVAGVFYMAVLVASLIGVRLSGAETDKSLETLRTRRRGDDSGEDAR